MYCNSVVRVNGTMYVMEWKVCKCKNTVYRFLIGFGLFMLVHRVNKYIYLTLKNYFLWHGLADLIGLYKPVLSTLENMPFAKSRVRRWHKTCLTLLCADCEDDLLEKFLGIFPKTEISEAERPRAKRLCLCLPMAPPPQSDICYMFCFYLIPPKHFKPKY